MAKALHSFSDPELEEALTEVGLHLAYPPTPALARAVGARLRTRPARRWWQAWAPVFWGRRELALAVAAAVLVLAAGLATLPGTRNAIADRLGLRGVHLKPEKSLPPLTPAPERTMLQLGRRLTLDEARALVKYRVLVPSQAVLGPPDEVYFTEPPSGGQVGLVYLSRPGYRLDPQTGVSILMTEFRGTVERDYFTKGLGPNTRVESVRVNGGPGFWIEGAAHAVYFFRDANGNTQRAEVRLAGNVLLWQQGELTLRLEGSFTKAQALQIAESIR
jgi:hypothetical protein